MADLPISRRSIGRLVVAGDDRAATRRYVAIQRAAFVQRAHDAAERDLAVGRIHDLTAATLHGLEDGDAIVEDLTRRIERNPAAQALIGIAGEGLDGIRDELRDLRGR